MNFVVVHVLKDVLQLAKSDKFPITDQRNVTASILRLYRACENRLLMFFGLKLQKLKTADTLRDSASLMIQLNSFLPKNEIMADLDFHIESLIQKSFDARLDVLMTNANFVEPIKFDSLLNLLDLISEELLDTSKRFNLQLSE